MPKEVIYATPAPYVAEVGWTRNLPGISLATIDPDAEVGTPASGWYIHLDRDGVNRLIRTLRKARDQAFGSDA